MARSAQKIGWVAMAAILAGLSGCDLYRQCDEGAVECFGEEHGRMCSGGRWYDFVDGPCLRMDTGTPLDDAGLDADDAHDADASTMDVPGS